MIPGNQPTAHPDLTAYVLGLAGGVELRDVQRHLDRCERCSRQLEELERLPRLLASAAPPVSPPAHLERRVLAAVRREMASGQDRRWPGWMPRWGRRPARWAPAWAAAVAFILLAAAGGLTLSNFHYLHPDAGTAQKPAPLAVHLVAADGGAANGAARIEDGPSGKLVALTVEGLAPNPPGQVYVCWLVDQGDGSEQPNRLPVGTFSVSGPEPVTMRWTTRGDTAHYRLEVTLEKGGGNPPSRGPTVLRAQ
ncbi:MAG: anti-sigma factor [Candidatus Dormibacteraeota bacterium]|nr:anti-sigma factor [Candidatus Dormibacteraeota bacterium]